MSMTQSTSRLVRGCIPILLMILSAVAASAGLDGFTAVGTVSLDSHPLKDVGVTLHSTALQCACSTELPDYAGSGMYSASVDNLVFDSGCTMKPGDACAQFITPEDDVWISVGDESSERKAWSSFEKKETVYFGIDLDLKSPPFPKQFRPKPGGGSSSPVVDTEENILPSEWPVQSLPSKKKQINVNSPYIKFHYALFLLPFLISFGIILFVIIVIFKREKYEAQ